MGSVLTPVRTTNEIFIPCRLSVISLYERSTDDIRIVDRSRRIAEREPPIGRKARTREVLPVMSAIRSNDSETILDRIPYGSGDSKVKRRDHSVEATAP